MSGDAPAGDDERTARRAFRLGAAVGLVAFLVVLTGARTLLSWVPAGDFYDAQADAFLDGRLDIDPERLGIEGFAHDGRTYMYQPPFPAILRLPVAAATDTYDGRLGQLSVLGALLSLCSATRRILVRRPPGLAGRGGPPPVSNRSPAPARPRRRRRLGADLPGQPGLGVPRVGHVGPGLDARRPSPPCSATATTPVWGTLLAVIGCTLGAVGSRASVGAGACAALGFVAVAALVRRDRPPVRSRLVGHGRGAPAAGDRRRHPAAGLRRC